MKEYARGAVESEGGGSIVHHQVTLMDSTIEAIATRF